jgi:ATP-dependent DNA ligase
MSGTNLRFDPRFGPRLESDDWQHEPKFDGYRAIGVRHGEETILFSRRGHIFNQRYQRLTRALQKLPGK